MQNQSNISLREFNLESDYNIMNILDGEELSPDQKKLFIEKYNKRINKMKMHLFLQTMRQMDSLSVLKCSDYILNKVRTLTTAQVEGLFYINKYYHEVSPIADLLLEQSWFLNDQRYKTYIIAYELERLLKEEKIDASKLEELGLKIVTQLIKSDADPELFDMVVKNYLHLIKEHYPEYLESLKYYGYKIIDEHIGDKRELTPNMIIFDCGITKEELPDELVDHFEFYEDKKDKAFAYAQANTIRINTAAIKQIYKDFKNKSVGTQMLFYVIGHEIDHVFCNSYKAVEKYFENDPLTRLKVFNSRVSEALQNTLGRNFYNKYHNCFAHEFAADIAGIKALYQKYQYLPSITDQDKQEVNKALAVRLKISYCMVTDNDGKQYGYLSPIEFTRDEFNDVKDSMPGYARFCLLDDKDELPEDLINIENNLNDEEKFMLGYYSKYIGIIDAITKGQVKSTNIFEDLPRLYDEYNDVIINKYPSYYESRKNQKKM